MKAETVLRFVQDGITKQLMMTATPAELTALGIDTNKTQNAAPIWNSYRELALQAFYTANKRVVDMAVKSIVEDMDELTTIHRNTPVTMVSKAVARIIPAKKKRK